jgi:GNAT superfamily N-acetyltransferase
VSEANAQNSAPRRQTIATKTAYLQMHAPPGIGAKAPIHGVAVERVERPSVEYYRFLYNSVGRDYHWIDRNRMPGDELRRIVEDERVEIYLLTVGGEPAGYAELDRRQEGEIELAYFGLFPAFVGRGLGKYFLNWAVERAWSHRPRRVWVHTCDLDHPAALPNYLKAGFVVYDEQVIQQVVESC